MKGFARLLVAVIIAFLVIAVAIAGVIGVQKAWKKFEEEQEKVDIFTRAMRLKMRGFSIEQLVMSDEVAKVATLYNFSDWTQASKSDDFNNKPNYYNLTYGGTYESLIEKCIVQSYMNGEPCLVAQDLKINLDISGGYTFEGPFMHIGDIPSGEARDVYVERDGVRQVLCKRSDDKYGDSPSIAFLSESDDLFFRDFKDFQPYIHGGFMPPEFRANKVFYEGNRPVVVLVSPFDIEKYPPQRVSLTIYVNDVDVSSGECKYNIYVFVQPQIGNSTNASTVRLFSYIRDITPDMLLWKSSSGESGNSIILNFNLSGEQHTYYEVFAAINAGLWEWNRLHFYDRGYIDAAKNVPVWSGDKCSDPIAVYWDMSTIYRCGSASSSAGCGPSVSYSSSDLNKVAAVDNNGEVQIKLYFLQMSESKEKECGINLVYWMYAGKVP